LRKLICGGTEVTSSRYPLMRSRSLIEFGPYLALLESSDLPSKRTDP
jgi:hypothetical protein